ncbi:MAG TPA: GNAT family N-acetyltransferase [Flavobacterium sp.]|jgi:GNAT superfamily N-acetyltransferase|nr:GNAT family N-acetyltransferase [Flavobacterium sp.]
MTTIIRTTSENHDFISLTALFDEFLIEIDGEEKDFFAQFNHIYLENVIVCYENDFPIGCGAFKKLEQHQVEIKRMFVHPDYRKKGVAQLVLTELETWAKELGSTICILETSIKLENAIALYKKSGFEIIPNYGQYIGVESSVCMQKVLK